MEPRHGCITGLNMTWIKVTTKSITEPDCLSAIKTLIDQLPFNTDVADAADREHLIESVRTNLLSEIPKNCKPQHHLWLKTMCNVVADLCNQRWTLKLAQNDILGQRPEDMGTREALRERLVSRRNQQLREKSVQQFISDMEKWRLFNGKRVSILSLMADGRELLNRLSDPDAHKIEPYIQFVSTDQTCEHTGLKLQDIWRYFRHTWANPYESIPGRSLLMLVRDAGAAFHPVMGISALSSAAVRLGARDQFIGWDTGLIIEKLRSAPTDRMAEWVLETLRNALHGIYIVDFIRDGMISPNPTDQITPEKISQLRNLSAQQKDLHHRMMESGEYKPSKNISSYTDEDWEEEALKPLFRSKRANELANILEIWLYVANAYAEHTGKDRLASLLTTDNGRNTFSKVVRIARSMTVGTEIADLTVCGAVAPYNHLAGGKLVAMLATSPEAVCGYRNRYQLASSIIASSMAGRQVTRSANLVFIGTTSLYGKRPNQYDRISYPASLAGGSQKDQIKYHFIPDFQTEGSSAKTTKGVGTFHFGPHTRKAMEEFIQATRGGWKVNNIFGEGASPKLRALRDGLDALGLNTEELLVHGIGKCIYGVNLVSNTAEYLLGVESKPIYFYNLANPTVSTRKISEWWYTRWATGRAMRKDVVEKIATETLVYPIRHKAKVILPKDEKEQLGLFQ